MSTALRTHRWPTTLVVVALSAIMLTSGPANASPRWSDPTISWHQLSGACEGKQIHGLHWNNLNGGRPADLKRVIISAEGHCYLRHGIPQIDDFSRISDAGYQANKQTLVSQYAPYTETSQKAAYLQRVAATAQFAQTHSTNPAAVRVALDMLTEGLDDKPAEQQIRNVARQI